MAPQPAARAWPAQCRHAGSPCASAHGAPMLARSKLGTLMGGVGHMGWGVDSAPALRLDPFHHGFIFIMLWTTIIRCTTRSRST